MVLAAIRTTEAFGELQVRDRRIYPTQTNHPENGDDEKPHDRLPTETPDSSA